MFLQSIRPIPNFCTPITNNGTLNTQKGYLSKNSWNCIQRQQLFIRKRRFTFVKVLSLNIGTLTLTSLQTLIKTDFIQKKNL